MLSAATLPCRRRRAVPGQGSIALDGKTSGGSLDAFHDRVATQVLSAFATDAAFVPAQAAEAVRAHRPSDPSARRCC